MENKLKGNDVAAQGKVVKTLRVRVKDKHRPLLNQWAFEVNQVWNAANELTAEYAWVPIPEVGYVNLKTSEFDLHKELRSIREDRNLSIGAATVQSVITRHAQSRKQFKRNKLRWRCSGGARRALGWIPFKKAGIQYQNGQIRFNGHFFNIWDSYGLSNYSLGTGSFSQDAQGRWYFNTTVEVASYRSEGVESVGLDLGLQTVATSSYGDKLDRAYLVQQYAGRLASAQRANKAKQVKKLHAKIKNVRKDAIHQFSTMMTQKYGAIFVGDVSSLKLVKTKLAKSVLDSGWGILKAQLEYKAKARSVVYWEVSERNTTLTCSHCLEIPDSSPKGRAGLRIREWTCSKCGVLHDRDINAAKNILRLGLQTLAGGIPTLSAQAAALG